MRKISLLLVSFLLLVSLCGCKFIKESSEYTRNTTEEFFSYISQNDYFNAKNLLHPDSYPSKDTLEFYILGIEGSYDIDFSDGVIIKSSKEFSFTGYTSEFGGSTYEVTYSVTISGKKLDLYVFLLKNDNGNGIYRFTLEV